MAKLPYIDIRRDTALWGAGIGLTFLAGATALMVAADVALQHWYVLTVPMILASFRFGRRGALVMSTLSLIVLIGVFQAAGQSYAQLTAVLSGVMTTEIQRLNVMSEEVQRVALQLADLRASDPNTAFSRALIGLGSIILTSFLLGSSVDRLAQLSWTDGLTGIANRRRFDARLDEEWRRAARQRATVSLLLIDIDHFKGYNDAYGHRRGDDCLRQVAAVFAGGARRAGDLAARYGGEEFVLLLPHTLALGARLQAETMRASVEELQIPNPGSGASPYVTVSVGVASVVPTAERSPSDLVGTADRALYRAKAEGRNRVSVAAEDGQEGPAAAATPDSRAAASRPELAT